jgi:glycosyltransferase involved in cell wall biosynthesis
MTRLLIVTPAFNEVKVLPDFFAAALALRRELASTVDVRVLVVDDGSRDGTAAALESAVGVNREWLSYISLTANAGHQAALIAGLCHAGEWPDAVVTMDADLEHPFAVIRELLAAWQQQSAIVVHAIRRGDRRLPLLKRVPSDLFYRVTRLLTGLNLQTGQADFRLWDAAVLRHVRDYLPHIGSLRLFAEWMPGPKAVVHYDQDLRSDRQTRFTFRKNLDLAAISIIRFSNFPLQAITVLGGIGLLFSIAYAVFIAYETAQGNTVPGWSSTVLIVMAMGCLQLIALGTIAGYLRRLVFARDLPPFVVRSTSLESPSRTGADRERQW